MLVVSVVVVAVVVLVVSVVAVLVLVVSAVVVAVVVFVVSVVVGVVAFVKGKAEQLVTVKRKYDFVQIGQIKVIRSLIDLNIYQDLSLRE